MHVPVELNVTHVNVIDHNATITLIMSKYKCGYHVILTRTIVAVLNPDRLCLSICELVYIQESNDLLSC